MSDSNNIFNDFTNFMNLLNKSDLFDTKTKSNIKIISENGCSSNNIIGESENKLINNDQTSNILLKKKSKCGICKVKISAVDELIATCKCEKTHCLKHRMPEAHSCEKIKAIGEEQQNNLKASLVRLDSKYKVEKI